MAIKNSSTPHKKRKRPIFVARPRSNNGTGQGLISPHAQLVPAKKKKNRPNMLPIEALAHYTRGIATTFFLCWAVLMFPIRRRSKMMQLGFIFTLWLAICYAKDLVFLFDELKDLDSINDIVGMIDLLSIPLSCVYFCETIRPNWITKKKFIGALLIQAAFIPAYIIAPTKMVIGLAYATALAMAISTLVTMMVFYRRFKRYIDDNYSYTEGIDAKWAIFLAAAFFVLFLSYYTAFHEPTWQGDCIFNLLIISIWNTGYIYARKHHVFAIPTGGEEPEHGTDPLFLHVPQPVAGERTDTTPDATPRHNEADTNDTNIAQRLEACMSTQKLYLNPKLTLAETAQAIGTNKTYLSDHINQEIGKTFYDYINEYRIQEACDILDTKTANDRFTMIEIAEQSGFNSLSTFNRHFYRIKGMPPRKYFTSQARGSQNN